jgi:TonB-linked SusC/RagA family outer membrane protein
MKQILRRVRSQLPLFCLMLLTQTVLAQKSINGRVIDKGSKAAIPNASIALKGTSTGTQTNANGTFTIKTNKADDVLTVTSVGYDAIDVSLSANDSLLIEMAPSNSTLNEILVTGYTAQRKKDITGSVSVVNTKELVANPGSNVESLLQGRASGVNVGTSGVPGAGASVRIRGFTTFNANEPLYIVDGARIGSISDLNPNDIESMQVLKDASAAAVYGAAAANGVIIVTTKKGKGQSKVTYDAYYGVQSLTKKYDLLNTEEYGQYLLGLQKGIPGQTGTSFNLGQYNGGKTSTSAPVIPEYILAGTASGVQAGDPLAAESLYKLDLNDVNGSGTYLIVPANKSGTDWMDAITHNAPMMNHSLTVSGGTGTGNYLFGINYFNQDGIIRYTDYKRYSVRANTNFTVKNFLKIGENLQVNYIDKHGFTNQDEGNAISMAYRMQPIVPVFDLKGNYGGTRGSNLGNASNPFANLQRGADNVDRKVGIIGSVYAEIAFLKYFTLKTVLGMDYGTSHYYNFGVPAYENAEGRGGTGNFNEGESFGYLTTWYNTLGFQKIFADKHDVKFLLGTEMVQGSGRGVDASTNNYFSFDRNFWQINAGLNTTPSGSSYEFRYRKYSPVIAKLDYVYNDKYLLSASFRRDGSSNGFGPNNKFGNFYSGSLGWRVSEENFMKGISWLNDLKLRAGYGYLGNDNIIDFGFLTTFVFDRGNASYPIDGSNTGFAPGLRHNSVGNPDVKWEEVYTTNIGLDASILDSRVNIVLDVYKRLTKDLLYERQLDPTIFGNVSRQPTNIGEMTNKGLDLSVNYRADISGDFRFDAGLTFSLYRNEVGVIADPFFEGNRSRIDPFNRSVTGKPISSFYGYIIDGFFQNQAEVDALDQANKGIGKWRYQDLNGDKKITVDDRTFMGNPHPNFTAGLNLSATFKNFDLAAFLYWKNGGDIVNYVRYWTDFNTFQGNRDKRVLYDSWTPNNRNAKLPVLDASDGASGQVPVSYFVENGGYLRLKNLALGYTVPTAAMTKYGIERIRIYVQAQNLFTITDYTGLDPEITTQQVGRGDYRQRRSDANSLGVDYGNFPTPRIITFGLNVTF